MGTSELKLLQEELAQLIDRAKEIQAKRDRSESSRSFAVAITHLETAALWNWQATQQEDL
jgi:hypothetical protein